MSWPGDRLVDVKREHESDFSINIDAVINAAKSEEAKMVFLASPNNPDGGMISDDDLKRLLELDCLVVLDEAYIEFSESASKLPWALNYDNLVVLRTFRCVLSLHFCLLIADSSVLFPVPQQKSCFGGNESGLRFSTIFFDGVCVASQTAIQRFDRSARGGVGFHGESSIPKVTNAFLRTCTLWHPRFLFLREVAK